MYNVANRVSFDNGCAQHIVRSLQEDDIILEINGIKGDDNAMVRGPRQ